MSIRAYSILSLLLLSISQFVIAESVYEYQKIVKNNPEVVKRLSFLKNITFERTVTIAVIGDYIHTDVFSDLINVNSLEIENNLRDDDLNNYEDDFYGMDFFTLNGRTNAPVVSGHENGIVSLIDAFAIENTMDSKIKVIPINIVRPDRHFDYEYLKRVADAIDYARIRGVEVISMSFGISAFYKDFFRFIDNDYNKSKAYLDRAITRARSAGILLIAASSNDYTRDQVLEPEIPAQSEGVISVANVTLAGTIQSAYGKNTDIAFYGNYYVWPGKNSDYIFSNGTSYATPVIALTLAAAKSLNPELNMMDSKFIKILRASCEKPIKGKKTVISGCVYSPEKFIQAIRP